MDFMGFVPGDKGGFFFFTMVVMGFLWQRWWRWVFSWWVVVAFLW